MEQLTKTWGAKWKCNSGTVKTESNRRMKIVNLVQELAVRPRWNIKVAIRFLSERYEPKYRARAFSDYLTTANKPAVFTAADVFQK